MVHLYSFPVSSTFCFGNMNFLVALFAVFVCSTIGNDEPRITINQGILVGKYTKSTNGRTFRAFIGIPYAKPPVGDLRFMPPVPAPPWTGVLDASRPHPTCPQLNVYMNDTTYYGNEDCLYLNIYTPQVVSNKLPVLFCIHGGGFSSGSALSDFFGPEHFLDNDIVLVTMNYRLGALGFLSTGDNLVPGNNGLKDQNLALQWTRSNIESFGGNPDEITVLGYSAGAASAHYHMVSPLSRDMIKGVISNSGTALATWALSSHEETQDNSRRLAQMLNCATDSTSEMVSCLKKVDAETIIKQELPFYKYTVLPAIPFKPVIEPNIPGAFIIEDARTTIKSRKAANVPFLTGVTTDEGAFISSYIFREPEAVDELHSRFSTLAPFVYYYKGSDSIASHVTSKIKKFYFSSGAITKSTLTKSITDFWFAIGADEAVRLHKQYNTAPVYYYQFSYRGSRSYTELYGATTDDYGVCHCDDLLYLFTSKMMNNYQQNQTDKGITNLMVNLWTNFAKTGNPTPPEGDFPVPIHWEPVSSDRLEYMSIKDINYAKMDHDLNLKAVDFWNSVRRQWNRIEKQEL